MAKKKVTADEISSEVVEVKKASTGTKEIIIERKKEETAEEKQEELSIAQKLLALYNLQQVCSKIDKILVERGELPNEVRDLEDALEGLKTRIAKYQDEITDIQGRIAIENSKIADSQALIKRYEEQQQNVRNNREYESLSKEIEYQTLEIQLSEKNKTKYSASVEAKTEEIKGFEEKVHELQEILTQKQSELEGILAETEEKEIELRKEAEEYKVKIEPRLLTAFERIRKNARNGLAIVQIERDACGGCFSTIPPQRQLDIRLHKKIIVCEACGRIFIDKQLVEEHQNDNE
ncbi:MAG: C4-type zinc ribbon domain-containing protein [Bacteroidales bacterium]|nr:C4-type zinc ribbon domain-containing protein [Bacteroidales bacterium]